jgi:hypothetical protein
MRVGTPAGKCVRLAVAALVALSTIPIESDTAEAGRIKLRFRTYPTSGSYAMDRKQDVTPAGPKPAATAASARAAAILAAEAAQAAPPLAMPAPLDDSRAKAYDNGTVCIAGCRSAP